MSGGQGSATLRAVRPTYMRRRARRQVLLAGRPAASPAFGEQKSSTTTQNFITVARRGWWRGCGQTPTSAALGRRCREVRLPAALHGDERFGGCRALHCWWRPSARAHSPVASAGAAAMGVVYRYFRDLRGAARFLRVWLEQGLERECVCGPLSVYWLAVWRVCTMCVRRVNMNCMCVASCTAAHAMYALGGVE